MLVTKRSYFGVGPAKLEPGDAIYVLAGGGYCYALRPYRIATEPVGSLEQANNVREESPSGQSSTHTSGGPCASTFEFIGDCYVHGIMDGEAVAERAPGYTAPKDRLLHETFGGRAPDPELPTRDFHDVYIV